MDNLAHAEAADQQAAEAPSEMDWHANFRMHTPTADGQCRPFGPHQVAPPGAVDRVPRDLQARFCGARNHRLVHSPAECMALESPGLHAGCFAVRMSIFKSSQEGL